MHSDSLIPNLQNLLEVSFLQEALFQLIEKNEKYTSLLVVNNNNSYLTLSNEDHYIFLLPVVNQQIVQDVSEAANFIFSRKKILVQLENFEEVPGFEDQFFIKIEDIIQQAEKNEVPRHNLFLRLLSEVFKKGPAN